MRKNRTRRITSAVLSVAMTAVSVFSDVTIPTLAADSTDTGQTASVSGLVSSITSDYLKKNMNEEVGQEVSERTVQDIEDQSYTVETTEETTDEEVLTPVTGNSTAAVEFSPNLARLALKVSPSENDEEYTGIANSDLEDVQTQTAYDENGLAVTYHYVLLNYSLVEEGAVSAGTTMDDVWENTPESFLASIPAYTNVYALEGNEDYLVAFADPSAINGTGKATYADFTDFNTENPTIYNDVVTFDPESGIIYIPKAFYYNEDGQEVIRELQAQILVPYSFDSENSNVSVEIDSTAGVSVKTGTTSVSTAALDVSMRVQVAEEGTTGLDDTSFKVYVNDDPLETEEIASYDAETGELTISVNPETTYALRIEVSDPVETVLSKSVSREILLASAADIPLGDILLAEDSYERPTNGAASMENIPEAAFNITYDELVAGDLFTYSGAYTYNGSPTEGTTQYNVIKATAKYCYYANDTTQQQAEYSGIQSGATLSTFINAGHDIVRRPDLKPGGDAFNLFNVLTTLPKGTYTSTSGNSAKFTTNLSKISGYPDDTSGTKNNTLVALHCAHITNGITSDSTEGVFSLAELYCRVLYVYTSSSESYAVIGIITPCVGLDGLSQAGYGMYKVKITQDKPQPLYARVGLQKEDSTSGAKVGEGYYIATTVSADYLDYIAEQLDSKTAGMTTTTKLNNLGSILAQMADASGVRTYSSSSLGYFLFKWDLEEGDEKTIYIREYIAPDTYDLDETIYTVKVKGDEDAQKSSIISATSSSSTSYPITFTTDTPGVVTVKEQKSPFYAAFDLKKVSNVDGDGVSGAIYAVFTNGSVDIAKEIQSQAVKNSDNKSSAKAKQQAAVQAANGVISAATTRLVGFIKTDSSGNGEIYKYAASTSNISSVYHGLIKTKTDEPVEVTMVEIYSPTGYVLNPTVYTFYVDPNGNQDSDYAAAVKASTIITDTSSAKKPTAYTFTDTTTNVWSTAASVTGNSTVSDLTVKVKEEEYLYGQFGVMKVDEDGDPVSGLVFDIYTGYSDGTLSGKLGTGITTGDDGFGKKNISGTTAYSTNGKEVSGTWTSDMESNKVFYVRENKSSAEGLNLVWDSTVYKVVVTGNAGTAKKSKITVTNMSTNKTVSTSTHADDDTEYYYFTQTNKVRKQLYGTFGIRKVDEDRIGVTGLKFNIYTTYSNGTLGGKLSDSITTSTNGYGALDISGVDDAVISGTWYDKNSTGTATTTKTFYVQEDQSSATGKHLVWNDTVYKVTITGTTDSSDKTKCSVSVTNAATGASVSTSKMSSGTTYAYFTQSNNYQTLYGKFNIQKINASTGAVSKTNGVDSGNLSL